jgi:hypothetical protein
MSRLDEPSGASASRSSLPPVKHTRERVLRRARALGWLAACGLLVGVGLASEARAAGQVTAPPTSSAGASSPSARHRVAVHVEGAGAGDLADTLGGLMPETVDLVPSKELALALAKQGQRLPFGLVISLDRQRKPVVARVRKGLEQLGAEALVVGFVRPRKQGGREALVLVFEPGRDEPSIEEVVALGTPGTKDELATALAEALDAWKPPPPPPEPEPAPTAEVAPSEGEAGSSEDDDDGDESSPSERPSGVVGHEILSVAVAFDLAGRFFDHNDGRGTNLRSYSTLAPAITGRLEGYPLATTGVPVLEGLGLYGEVRSAVGLSSATDDGTSVDTSWLRFGGGMRLRMPFGPREAPFVVAARGGLVRDAFTLEASGQLGEEVPSVGYTFVRGGLDGRFPLGPIALTVEAGYLGALEAGEVAARFRDATLGGIDVGGGIAVPIAYGFEARLTGQYVRWFYAFKPVPGDAFVAGGALDEYLHVELGPAYVY